MRISRTFIATEPDLTFIVDMPPDAALRRGLARQSGEDRFEDMGLDFQEKLRAGFLRLAKERPERCLLIDGMRSPDAVADEIVEIVEHRW